MAVVAMKHMASNFAKLDKFKGVDFRRWQKNMHFLLSSISVVYVLTTHIPEDGGDDATVEQIRKRVKWDNDDYLCKGLIFNDMSDSLFDIYQNVESFQKTHTWKHLKEELTLVELGSHLRIEESLKVQDSDKPKGNNVVGPLVVNMVEHNNSSTYNDNKGKRKHHHNTRADPNKKEKPTCWKCGKTGHLKRDCKGVNVGNKANGSGTKDSVDNSSNSLKCQNMFNKSLQVYYVTYVSEAYFVQDNDVAWLNIVNDNITSTFMSTSKLNDSILWHARLGHVHFKRMKDMSKDGLIPTFNMDTEKCKTCMLTKITKKPFQNVKRETKVLEMIHSDLCDLHATPSLGNKKYFVIFINDASRIPNKRNKITPYKLWTKRKPNLNYLRVWGCKAIVRLSDPKLKTLGKRGIECIFVGYAEHSKTFRFYVIEPNDSVLVNSIIESKDAIFDENTFSSVPRPSLRIPNGTMNIGGSVVPEEVTKEVVQQPEPELRKSKRNRTPKNFGPEFQLYLTEGTRDKMLLSGKKQLMMRWTPSWATTPSGTYQYHKIADYYDINSQSDYSSDGCEDSFLEWPDIAFSVVLEGYTDASWISNSEDNSSTSGWVFLLGRDAISWPVTSQIIFEKNKTDHAVTNL
ncbi:zinc finger, CCHC-type containing protein [Tanacetum coccineum]|uniref:Zinc finger, CCHC-type containing protein n=1 Tax=Tanacetum coccineum TaxID=301880 RepID=A0ABQ5E7S9_9ASTR